MASFILHTENVDDHYHDDAHYSFNDAGMLVIDDGTGKRRIYSPAGWTSLETDSPTAAVL